MSRADEIRVKNEQRIAHDFGERDYGRSAEYPNGKRDDDYDREHREFYDSACRDITFLLALLDTRTEALKAAHQTAGDTSEALAAIHKAAREALTEVDS